jgi:phosphoribosylamine--glycine ligase
MTRFEGDLAALMLAVATGTLAQAEAPAFSRQTALTIVMATNGYPSLPEKGGVIHLADVKDAKIFHAGTAEVGGQLVASGGRVLNVTATGDTVTHAQAVAYAAVDSIDFPGGFCRRDIGWREVAREAASGAD